MQPNLSKNTRVRDHASRIIWHAGLGVLLSFAGCMATPVDGEQVDPGATSSELGIAPGPGIAPVASGPAGAAGAPASPLFFPPTAGSPGLAPLTAPCATDADCRVERDNCSECACQVLGLTQHLAACYGEKVTCVLDPCADTVARCIQGHCAAESDGIR